MPRWWREEEKSSLGWLVCACRLEMGDDLGCLPVAEFANGLGIGGGFVGRHCDLSAQLYEINRL